MQNDGKRKTDGYVVSQRDGETMFYKKITYRANIGFPLQFAIDHDTYCYCINPPLFLNLAAFLAVVYTGKLTANYLLAE